MNSDVKNCNVEGRLSISAFIITFNEEDDIEACLQSLDFCDEIVVVDSFSTDKTVEIASKMGARVVQRSWAGYRDQKAYGLSLVKNEWVINLDADERVSPELRKSILQMLDSGHKNSADDFDDKSEICGYYINRVVFYLGRWWRQGGWYPEYRLRIFRRSRTVWGGVEPHEKPVVDGRAEILPGELYHYTYKRIDDQFQQLHRFAVISAHEEYQARRKVSIWQLTVNPAMRAFKFFIVKRGYKEGIAGLIVALAEGYYVFMKYAKLWELYFLEGSENDHGQERKK